MPIVNTIGILYEISFGLSVADVMKVELPDKKFFIREQNRYYVCVFGIDADHVVIINCDLSGI